jgi:hypothetical protein
MEETRKECTNLVSVIDFLKDRQKESKTPEVYRGAIKKLRRELLGLYAQILNTRKPVDNTPCVPIDNV